MIVTTETCHILKKGDMLTYKSKLHSRREYIVIESITKTYRNIRIAYFYISSTIPESGFWDIDELSFDMWKFELIPGPEAR